MKDSYKLSEFLGEIKEALQTKFPAMYPIIGEIGDMKINRNGHCYLELVEKKKGEIIARCRATIWAKSYSAISSNFVKNTGEELKEGMNIMVFAQVSYHESFGLSLNILDIDSSFTLGERARQKKEVIEKLKAEGILKKNKNLEIPLIPQKIAIISSESAAGYQDFTNHLSDNSYGYQVNITLYKAIMQGKSGAGSIVEALKNIFYDNEQNNYDLVALLRGGGSQLDLDCFDAHELSRAVARFPLPIITGIGHDRDETITDMVAHTPLKTPTAVADYILSRFIEFEESMLSGIEIIRKKIQKHCNSNLQELEYLKSQFIHASDKILTKNENELKNQKVQLINGFRAAIKDHNNTLNLLSEKVKSSNPDYILKKGYSLLTYKGRIIRDPSVLAKGDEITNITENLRITSEVKELKKKNQS